MEQSIKEYQDAYLDYEEQLAQQQRLKILLEKQIDHVDLAKEHLYKTEKAMMKAIREQVQLTNKDQ